MRAERYWNGKKTIRCFIGAAGERAGAMGGGKINKFIHIFTFCTYTTPRTPTLKKQRLTRRA